MASYLPHDAKRQNHERAAYHNGALVWGGGAPAMRPRLTRTRADRDIALWRLGQRGRSDGAGG